MSKQRKTTIEVGDVDHAEVYLFRVIEMENGACKQSLPCRVGMTENGWTISFFGPHEFRNAEWNYKPLTAIPVEISPLAKVAFDKADELWKNWLNHRGES